MRNNPGFTLVEVLVISPIIILFIGAFIALLVTLTGESLVIREKNLAVHDTQAALDDMQADIGDATGFLATTADLGAIQSPQGKNDSAQPFTNTNGSGNPETLIVRKIATDKNPNDPTRQPIFTGAGACDAKNPIYTYLSIYFVALDTETSDPNDKALYKRIVLPNAAACDIPWQKGSCKTVTPATKSWCQTYDEKLVGGVAGLDVTYYTNGTATAESSADTANDASITLTVSKTIAGSAIDYSSSARTSSPNAEASSSETQSGGGMGAPQNPAIQFTRNSTDPYRTTVTWTRIGNATGYTAKYRVAGGAVQSVSINQPGVGSSPSLIIDAAARKQTVQLTELKVQTGSGSADYGTLPTIPNIPQWNECTLQTNPTPGQTSWRNYGSVYNTMGFTKTSTGVVGLKGLVTDGTLGPESNKAVCILPVGFRPTEHIIVQQPAAAPSGDRAARVDIYPDGRVHVVVSPYGNSTGTSSWVSMDGLMFVTSSSNPSWVNGTYYNSWYFNSYSDGYGQLKSFKDSLGRTWVQGIATGGSQSAIMSYLPSGYAPDGGMHYPMYSDTSPNSVNFYANSSDRSMRSRGSGSYLGTNAVFYSSTGGKYALPLYNGWANYNNGWATAQCFKGADDIVILQGLVNNGNPSAGGLTNIAGCAGGGNAAMSTGKNAILGGVAYSGAAVDNAYRIDLVTDNYMYPYGGGASSGWTSLDGVHYIAD